MDMAVMAGYRLVGILDPKDKRYFLKYNEPRGNVSRVVLRLF